MDESALRALLDEPLDWRWKGIPPDDAAEPVTLATIAERRWNLLDGDLLFPAMILKDTVLDANIGALAEYSRRHGVWLAPHGKTPMAPEIFRRQLDAGAWGITASTPSQVRVYRHFGVPRILMAYQLVQPAALRWVAGELDRDPSFEFLCLVDSEPGVDLMTRVLSAARPSRPIRVLVELGHERGRTGARTIEEAMAVAEAVRRSPVLELAGTEGYEGLIHGRDLADRIALVERYLLEYRRLHEGLTGAGAFDNLEYSIASAGGSAMFDVVVRHLTSWDLDPPVRTILRSGTAVTHDDLMYEEVSPLAGRAPAEETLRLLPALELWGVVLSRPEAGLAILSFGRRDVGFDAGLPIPRHAVRPGSRELRPLDRSAFTVSDLNDQHAYLRLPAGDSLAVGDMVGCGVSHPCTAFDKWRLILTVNDDYDVVGGCFTFF